MKSPKFEIKQFQKLFFQMIACGETSRSRRVARSTSMQYAACEPRQLLAGISFSNGELVIGGSNEADTSTVSISGDSVSASLTGFSNESFTASDVEKITFIGLDGDDVFTNLTSIPSAAFGLAGNDTLIGGDGADTLVGGLGTDDIAGNGGDDILRGGIAPGDDIIDGGDGNDRIFGSNGSNEIHGGDGDDVIFSAAEADTIFGGAGNDEIFPGHGENEVHAGEGDDLVIGGRDADTIFGDAGNDRIFAVDGDDIIDGGAGDDRILGFSGDDTITGGTGNDRIFGLDGNDTITAGDGDDFLSGGEGIDILYGGEGVDELRGFAGNDILDGGADNDRVVFHRLRSQYQIYNDSPLYVSNTGNGDEGRDQITNAETLIFLVLDSDGKATIDERLEAKPDVVQRITIQPIIVSNTDGSNSSEFMGDAASEKEIKMEVNNVLAQNQRVASANSANFSMDARWLAPRTWNNSFANIGNGGSRPINDTFEIIDNGKDSNLASSDELVINMYFVEVLPGTNDSSVGENTVQGISLDDGNGVVIHIGDDLLESAAGRLVIARTIVHEIAHNLSLQHVTDSSNLMVASAITSDTLTSSQSSTMIDSRYSRTI